MKDNIKKIIYWIFILTLGISIHSLRIEYIGGIQIVFVGIFTSLLLKKHSLQSTVIILTAIHMLSVIFFNVSFIQILFIIEAFCIGILYKKFKNCSLVIIDLIFWICLGAPIYGIILFNGIIDYDTQYIQFFIVVRTINSVINVLVFEVITTYIPYVYDRLSSKKKLRIELNKLIFHMIMVLITIPMILNIYTTSSRYNQQTMDYFSSYANDIFQTIQQEINKWSSREKQKFQLYDVVQRGKIRQIINDKGLKESMFIIITNEQDKILFTTNNQFKSKEDYHLESYQNIKLIDKEFYRVVPQKEGKLGLYDDNGQTFSIIKHCIPTVEIKMYMLINLGQYISMSIEGVLEGFMLLLVFWILIVVVIIFLHYKIFKASNRLYTITTHLPENIDHIEELEWTDSYIEEIYCMEKNFKETAYKLKEMFDDTSVLNEKLEDKTEKLKQSQKRLYNLVYIDPLTGIGNRLKMKEDMMEITNQPYNVNKLTAICLLDIKQFKENNNILGHAIGDLLLSEVAQRLQSICKDKEIQPYRLGGDEFVILAQVEDITQIQTFSKEVSKLFDSPFIISEFCLQIDSSIGISIYPYHTNDMNTALKYADIAMKQSRVLAPNTAQIFNESLKEAFTKKKIIENSVKQAIEHKAFRLYYQPKFDLVSQKLTGMEALIRWNGRIMGNVEASIFFTVAEEIGLISSVNEWVIENTCRQIREWKQCGKYKVPIAINISQTYFKQREFLQKLRDNMEQHEIQASDLIIEITEKMMIKDEGGINEVILELKEMGVKVSLDDFGVGYCSFKQFLDLSIEEIKIDQVLIKDIDKESRHQLAVKYIIEMTHQLGIRLVAKGIETKEEFEYIKHLGCDEGQGFFFCKPINNKEIEKFL